MLLRRGTRFKGHCPSKARRPAANTRRGPIRVRLKIRAGRWKVPETVDLKVGRLQTKCSWSRSRRGIPWGGTTWCSTIRAVTGSIGSTTGRTSMRASVRTSGARTTRRMEWTGRWTMRFLSASRSCKIFQVLSAIWINGKISRCTLSRRISITHNWRRLKSVTFSKKRRLVRRQARQGLLPWEEMV